MIEIKITVPNGEECSGCEYITNMTLSENGLKQCQMFSTMIFDNKKCENCKMLCEEAEKSKRVRDGEFCF